MGSGPQWREADSNSCLPGRIWMTQQRNEKPIVYSCSGCSSAAQMTNYIAVALDRRGYAEMSCIAGVGGDVPSLVNKAKGGREIIAIDGCALGCVRACLARHNIVPDQYYSLRAFGVAKRYGADFDIVEAENILAHLAAACQLPQ
jgi:uncharacterized metal-binding protein